MPAFAVGVDLGGTNLRIAAIDEDGKQLEVISTSTEVKRGRDYVIGEMCASIAALAGKYRSTHRFLGTGIGVPGIIEMESGMVRESPNLPDWRDFPVREEIERRLAATVVLENDANAAALGEKWMGAAREHDDMCMLTLGTGVGGGLVLNGKVWHGMTGMAAELGHICVDPQGPPCGCGSRGCIEQYASATAVKRMAVEAIASGDAPELARAMSANPEFSAKMIFQYAAQGDASAGQIFARVGTALGIVLAGLVNALNLPIYVIGGGVSSAWEAFSPALFQELQQRSFVYRATAPDPTAAGRNRTIVTRALLGSDAGLVGAARLPMMIGTESRG
jgi:glucokinase